jgi:hypothetical protein
LKIILKIPFVYLCVDFNHGTDFAPVILHTPRKVKELDFLEQFAIVKAKINDSFVVNECTFD